MAKSQIKSKQTGGPAKRTGTAKPKPKQTVKAAAKPAASHKPKPKIAKPAPKPKIAKPVGKPKPAPKKTAATTPKPGAKAPQSAAKARDSKSPVKLAVVKPKAKPDPKAKVKPPVVDKAVKAKTAPKPGAGDAVPSKQKAKASSKPQAADVAASAKATPGKATPGKATPGKATPGKATPGKATPGKATPGKATPGKGKKKGAPAVPAEPPAPPKRWVRPPKPEVKQVAVRKVKRVNFDAKTLASIKEGLESERERLVDQLAEIEEQAFNASQSEISGEVGYDEDYADAGTATFERERDLSIANNTQDLIDKIGKALGKIADGSYGLCESCGEPIPADRLKALPHVFLCIRCKKAEERR